MKRVIISALLAVCLTAACTGETTMTEGADAAAATADALPAAPSSPADPDAPKPDPEPYVPAGRPGSAADYDEMIARLEQIVPAELRTDVPWPDLRNPDPAVAQIEIFELWIWMAANVPDPELVEAMAAPGSPSREQVVSVFGRLQSDRVFEIRNGQPYRAFDHLVITFDSAGLPLWLTRDVPDNAVVVYYSDSSGPVEVVDQDSGAVLSIEPALPTRTWLSIMVATDVGWQLWRDQLIDPSNSELQVPDVPPHPGADVEERTPEV